MPFEPKKNPAEVRIDSYPVVKRAGLLFVYLGPQGEQPAFPEWDILNRTDGCHEVLLQEAIDCNWFQIQENAADVTHTFFLHSGWMKQLGIDDTSGFDKPLLAYGFQPFEHGILKSWSYNAETGEKVDGWGNLLVFPNILRIETEMHWRIPIDVRSTRIIILNFTPGTRSPKLTSRHLPPRKDHDGKYDMNSFFNQDAMAWETQGQIADRRTETLGASDAGIAMFRHMFTEQLERVARGETPSVAYPREHAVIDLRRWMGGYLPMSAPPDSTPVARFSKEQIFDERHRTFPLNEK